MEELDFFKDYVELDDTYLEFFSVDNENGYGVGLKDDINLKKEVKILIPSFYKNKPIKRIVESLFENEKIIGLAMPDTNEQIDFDFPENIYTKELYIGKNCELKSFINFQENRLERIVVSKENKLYDSRNDCNAIIEKQTDDMILGCNKTIIPNDIQILSINCFAGCLKIDKIILPESLIKIEDCSFYKSCIKELFVPKNVAFIEYQAFCSCDELEKIIIDKDNPYYDSRENSNTICETSTNTLILACKNSIIPDSIKIIENHAFDGIYPYSELIIPDNVEIIEKDAFINCHNIKKICIGKNVKEIYFNPFTFINIKRIEVSKDNPYYDSRDNSNAVIDSCLNKLVVGTSNTIIPKSVKSIGREAFRGCFELEKIEIPESIIEIDGGAFEYCASLKLINLPKKIKINLGAFYACNNLNSIEIPKDSCLDAYSFDCCENLKAIYNLDNAKYLAQNAFFQSHIELITLNKELNKYMRRYIFKNFEELETIIYKNKEYKRKDLSNDENYWYFENEEVVINEIK